MTLFSGILRIHIQITHQTGLHNNSNNMVPNSFQQSHDSTYSDFPNNSISAPQAKYQCKSLKSLSHVRQTHTKCDIISNLNNERVNKTYLSEVHMAGLHIALFLFLSKTTEIGVSRPGYHWLVRAGGGRRLQVQRDRHIPQQFILLTEHVALASLQLLLLVNFAHE